MLKEEFSSHQDLKKSSNQLTIKYLYGGRKQFAHYGAVELQPHRVHLAFRSRRRRRALHPPAFQAPSRPFKAEMHIIRRLSSHLLLNATHSSQRRGVGAADSRRLKDGNTLGNNPFPEQVIEGQRERLLFRIGQDGLGKGYFAVLLTDSRDSVLVSADIGDRIHRR